MHLYKTERKGPFIADVEPFFLVHHEDSNINKNQGNKTAKKSQSWCFTSPSLPLSLSLFFNLYSIQNGRN